VISLASVRNEIESNLSSSNKIEASSLLITGSIHTGLLGLFLRLEASRRKVQLTVKEGSFDNPISDISESGTEAVVLVPFFDGVVQDFENRLLHLEDTEVEVILEQFISRWTSIINAANPHSRVVILGLHTISPRYPFGDSLANKIVNRFNKELQSIVGKRPGSVFVDMNAIIGEIGRRNSFDFRMYQRAKNPYAAELTSVLAPLLLDALKIGSRVVKVLVLDCDNTIWGGVISEDGFNGINLDPNDSRGAMYRDVQRRILELKQLGLLICLVSKNDEQDVLNVLDNHEFQLIGREDVVTWRINWDEKSKGIESIASELDLGLSSFVFIDDSEFECAEVQRKLPDVLVIAAPTRANEYVALLAQLKFSFLQGRDERVSDKTSEYAVKRKIDQERSSNSSPDDFLSTLDIRLEISIDSIEDLSRISEMFLKTNQFNTTSRRRTEGEVASLIRESNTSVISIRVNDRFTSHGLTAVAVLRQEESTLHISDWLMSCRILGRQIERGIIAFFGEEAERRSCNRVQIESNDSGRNGQVIKFLEDLTHEYGDSGRALFEVDLIRKLSPSWIRIER
jgi:FkbH-like protein